MLTGNAFFADRDEGLIWCDGCVPAEVVLLAGRTIDNVVAGGSPGRFTCIESGELLVNWIKPRDAQPQRIRARCHLCGVTQPPASANGPAPLSEAA